MNKEQRINNARQQQHLNMSPTSTCTLEEFLNNGGKGKSKKKNSTNLKQNNNNNVPYYPSNDHDDAVGVVPTDAHAGTTTTTIATEHNTNLNHNNDAITLCGDSTAASSTTGGGTLRRNSHQATAAAAAAAACRRRRSSVISHASSTSSSFVEPLELQTRMNRRGSYVSTATTSVISISSCASSPVVLVEEAPQFDNDVLKFVEHVDRVELVDSVVLPEAIVAADAAATAVASNNHNNAQDDATKNVCTSSADVDGINADSNADIDAEQRLRYEKYLNQREKSRQLISNTIKKNNAALLSEPPSVPPPQSSPTKPLASSFKDEPLSEIRLNKLASKARSSVQRKFEYSPHQQFMKDRLEKFPKFFQEELHQGTILGKGQFGMVSEIKYITLRQRPKPLPPFVRPAISQQTSMGSSCSSSSSTSSSRRSLMLRGVSSNRKSSQTSIGSTNSSKLLGGGGGVVAAVPTNQMEEYEYYNSVIPMSMEQDRQFIKEHCIRDCVGSNNKKGRRAQQRRGSHLSDSGSDTEEEADVVGKKGGKGSNASDTMGFHPSSSSSTGTSNCRYALKILQSKHTHNDIDYYNCARDMAIEAHFLAALEHPHILKLRGLSVDPMGSPNFFLVTDKLCTTLKETLQEWKVSQKRLGKRYSSTLTTKKLSKFLTTASSGGSKTQLLLKERKRQFCELRINYIRDLTSAVLHLHNHNIIQRDLKPDNIGFDLRGELKLFDFGLSTELPTTPQQKEKLFKQSSNASVGSSHKKQHNTKQLDIDDGFYKLTGRTGSLRYMAPEVYNHMRYNTSVDIYALSIVIWQMMTLEKLYPSYDKEMIIRMVIQRGVRPDILVSHDNMNGSHHYHDGKDYLKHSKSSDETNTDYCSLRQPMKEMLHKMWHVDPLMRPTAKFVQLKIQNELMFLQEEKSQLQNLLQQKQQPKHHDVTKERYYTSLSDDDKQHMGDEDEHDHYDEEPDNVGFAGVVQKDIKKGMKMRAALLKKAKKKAGVYGRFTSSSNKADRSITSSTTGTRMATRNVTLPTNMPSSSTSTDDPHDCSTTTTTTTRMMLLQRQASQDDINVGRLFNGRNTTVTPTLDSQFNHHKNDEDLVAGTDAVVIVESEEQSSPPIQKCMGFKRTSTYHQRRFVNELYNHNINNDNSA